MTDMEKIKQLTRNDLVNIVMQTKEHYEIVRFSDEMRNFLGTMLERGLPDRATGSELIAFDRLIDNLTGD